MKREVVCVEPLCPGLERCIAAAQSRARVDRFAPSRYAWIVNG